MPTLNIYGVVSQTLQYILQCCWNLLRITAVLHGAQLEFWYCDAVGPVWGSFWAAICGLFFSPRPGNPGPMFLPNCHLTYCKQRIILWAKFFFFLPVNKNTPTLQNSLTDTWRLLGSVAGTLPRGPQLDSRCFAFYSFRNHSCLQIKNFLARYQYFDHQFVKILTLMTSAK